jgi:hypothetical protein
MGRIVTPVMIENLLDPTKKIETDASVAAVDMVGHRLAHVRCMDME